MNDGSKGAPSAATLILSLADVAALINPLDCQGAVEEAFRRYGTGQAAAPGLLGFHTEGGGFHIKVGRYTQGGDEYFVAKTNANFPQNPALRGLPTVQGVIQVFDARSGVVLALMDSIEVTTLRTAAATAVAAKYLARADASVLTIAGCGTQGRAHLRALTALRPIERVLLWDLDRASAERMAAETDAESDMTISVLDALADGVPQSHMVVTCTPSTDYLVDSAWVTPGSFIAGVGADNEDKRELEPEVLARSKVVVDVLDQCAQIGDLHHALDAGVMRRADVHAELGEIVAGRKPGRTTDEEVFVFDSTGMALQDAATATLVVERARTEGLGVRFRLGTSNQLDATTQGGALR